MCPAIFLTSLNYSRLQGVGAGTQDLPQERSNRPDMASLLILRPVALKRMNRP